MPLHTSTPRPATPLSRSVLLLASGCFLAGMLLMQVFLHRESLLQLTHESYQARFHAMTSTSSGPQRYYVFHDPGITLLDPTQTDPAVMAIDVTPLDGLTRVDLASGNPASIDRIRALDGVHYAIRSNIPLFCH